MSAQNNQNSVIEIISHSEKETPEKTSKISPAAARLERRRRIEALADEKLLREESYEYF